MPRSYDLRRVPHVYAGRRKRVPAARGGARPVLVQVPAKVAQQLFKLPAKPFNAAKQRAKIERARVLKEYSM